MERKDIGYLTLIGILAAIIVILSLFITTLQAHISLQYEELKKHSFTYYVVGDAINISNVGIYYEGWLYWTINGTVTNISDKPIQTLYVYLILRNPDGTAVFDPYEYEKIENLYIGETATFEFSIWDYDESQTVEFLLIY